MTNLIGKKQMVQDGTTLIDFVLPYQILYNSRSNEVVGFKKQPRSTKNKFSVLYYNNTACLQTRKGGCHGNCVSHPASERFWISPEKATTTH